MSFTIVLEGDSPDELRSLRVFEQRRITDEIAEGMQTGSHSHLYLVQETQGELLQKLLATAGANILARCRVGSLEAILAGPPPS